MTATQGDRSRHAHPMVSGDGGFDLHVICVVCNREAIFRGVVMSLAAQRAAVAGWYVDTDALHVGAHERYSTCPEH